MRRPKQLLTATLLTLAMIATACGGSDDATTTTADPPAAEPTETTAATAVAEPTTPAPTAAASAEPATAPTATAAVATPAEPTVAAVVVDTATTALSCEDTAALFVTRGSANPTLNDPEVSASCIGNLVTITANGIPDYTYIETSPGDPRPQNLTFVMPATPTATTEYTAVPYVGPIGVAVNGVPIYGPTEGQGGDVLSLGGGLSECGSHNGPTGFHAHLFSTSSTTDCLYTPEEVAESPQLFGYAVDGYPIYTGNDQYTSSWVLTDESLFATDTWEAHSYVEGSGDLDQCNGRTDDNGNYAYYTTDTFPYVIGCFAGVVDLEGSGAGGGGGLGAGPGDDGGREAPAGGEAPAEGGPAEGEDGPGGGGAGGGGGGPDFTEAAAALGITVEELEAALGGPPPDFDAAAAALGITAEELEAVLPAPPGR